ncbi:TMhelix containing protein [Vibrio phage 1.121.O._10N.286.46.C4]|nr:TMhelix containing protein [Vibrio phage 1.121.O._10N.286.46.C4]
MIPYLLFIILLMYGEFSKDIHTRFISRTLLYCYATYQLLPNILLFSDEYIVVGNFVMMSGIGYVIIRARNLISRFAFIVAGLSFTLNTVAIYLQEYTILLSIPYYAEYSHIIIRESLITGVAAFATWKGGKFCEDDWKLNAIVFWLFGIEVLYIE